MAVAAAAAAVAAAANCSSATTIVWFRRDLRVEDNPALVAAAKAGSVVPIFIWCAEEEGEFRPGRVSRWWLKQSLMHLDSSLTKLGCSLVMRRSRDSLSVLLQLARDTKATQLFYNHLYDPVSLIRDQHVKQGLQQYGITVKTFNADLLYEPWELLDSQGHPFTYFQAFWNRYLNMDREPDGPLLPPKRLTPPPDLDYGSSSTFFPLVAEDLGLEDDFEKSSNAILSRNWTPGWTHANKALEAFLAGPLADYQKNRDKVENSSTTSRLSPHLHYGELSIRKIFHQVRSKQLIWATDGKRAAEQSAALFLRALGYREYSRYLCFHFPFTHERSLLGHLRHFPWRVDEGFFKAWRQGRTGYPLVDAGMRELWATGWLHNRIRVIVSSFCVKFLQLPWRWGMKYFWDTLLDADLESDILGWQYISGSLPDGHELDRMEIPQIEGRRFDPEGNYVRRWLPELSRLPTEWVHEPWNAPPSVLCAAGIELGCNYPRPIVEIAAARGRLQAGLLEMWELNSGSGGNSRMNLHQNHLHHLNLDERHTPSPPQQEPQEQAGRLQPDDDPEQEDARPASPENSSHPDQIVPTLPDESFRLNALGGADRRIPVLPGQHHHRHPQGFNFGLAPPQFQAMAAAANATANHHHLHQRQPLNQQNQQYQNLQNQGDDMMDSDADSTAESSSAFRRNYHHHGFSAATTVGAAPWFSPNRRRVDFPSYL